MKEIIKDLNKRGLSIAGFIAHDEQGGIVVISYDEKGLVNFISQKATGDVHVFEKGKGTLMTPMAQITRPKI